MAPNPVLYHHFEVLFQGRLSIANYRKGDYLYWEDSPARYLYGIREGVVKVVRNGFHGKEWIVRLAGQQEVLALCDVVDKQNHSGSGVAVARTTVWRIPATTFRQTLERDRNLGDVVNTWMVRHIRRLEIALELFSNGKAEERIANLLARMAIPCGDGTGTDRCVPFRLTRKDMAEMVGITPETCSRTLSEFKRIGLIREAGDRLLHVDAAALRDYFRRLESGHEPMPSGRRSRADEAAEQRRY